MRQTARSNTAAVCAACEPDPTCIPYQVFTYQGVTKEAADSLSATGITSATTGTEGFQAYVTGNPGWVLAAGLLGFVYVGIVVFQ